MKDILIEEYNNIEQLNLPFRTPENVYKVNFIEGASLEVQGPQEKEYLVRFIDQKTNKIEFESTIKNNMWTKTNLKYFIDWLIEVYDATTKQLLYTHKFDASGKRVYIHLDSSAIGDTLAWFAHADEFRKKHNCKLVCSTFHNEWFEKTYPEIEFVKPGVQVYDLYAMYGIGWFYNDGKVDFDRVPIDFKKLPLHETATSILNLSKKEVKPNIYLKNPQSTIKDKYVVIAPHASAHAKYWLYPNGWQTVINYLKDKGYKVVLLTQEKLGNSWHDSKINGTLKGVVNKTGDFPIEERMVDILNAEAFIGVGSGLSWLSWALGTKTVLISGFSYDWTEFEDCERISAPIDKCAGCFNRKWLDPGDWEWCPDHKDTERQFECTKTIHPDQIINSLNKILNIY